MGQFILSVPPTASATTFVYRATGGEGNPAVSPVPGLAGKTIDLVTYNTLVLIPETPPPDAQGYYYDGTNIYLGIPLNPGDVLQIVYS
jgi:hypothetical protein